MTDNLPAPLEPDDELLPHEDEEHKPFEPYDGLTPQRQAFVDAYVETGSGAESCRRAGIVKRDSARAKQTARELLNVPIVAAAVAQKRAERSMRTMITTDRVLQEVAILAFSNIDDYILDEHGNVTVREGVPEDAMRAIASVKRKERREKDENGNIVVIRETELRLWDKPGSIKMAGQHMKMFTERVDVNVKGKVQHEHRQAWTFGDDVVEF